MNYGNDDLCSQAEKDTIYTRQFKLDGLLGLVERYEVFYGQDRYVDHIGTPVVGLLQGMIDQDFHEEFASMRLISELSPEQAKEVAFTRDIFHYVEFEQEVILPQPKEQMDLLTTPGSVVRLTGCETNPYIAENAQVSILVRNTLLDGIIAPSKNIYVKNSKKVRPYFLSVPPPALDDVTCVESSERKLIKSVHRPEIATYIDDTIWPPKLNKNKYRIAHETIRNHILRASDMCNSKRVVLCEFGVKNHLKLLEYIDKVTSQVSSGDSLKKKAITIAAQTLAEAISFLRDNGREVCYSINYGTTNPYWTQINANLKVMSMPPVLPVNGTYSAIGEGWARETDLIVIEGDSHTLMTQCATLNID